MGFIDEMLELFCFYDKEFIGILYDIIILLFGFLFCKMIYFGFILFIEYNWYFEYCGEDENM